ncbi:MAG: hypothetical protein GXP32_10425 [Kiritimatiellaeota bacterium]|nr:hypothetical protein [Kiritimatiellota bacterium]
MRNTSKRIKRVPGHGESGQAIIESLFTMIVLCILLFGLLQVFQIAVASLMTSYSAFTANRSYMVGFSADDGPWWRELVHKSARVAAIGASGKRIFPVGSNETETAIIKRYLEDTDQWLEYEYWGGKNEYDSQYYRCDVEPPSTYIGYRNTTDPATGIATMTVSFRNYPFAIMDLMDPDRVWFDTVESSRDISHSASLYDHAVDFMIEE